jgi:hypothetical protein
MRDRGRAVNDFSESIGTRPPGGSVGVPHEVYGDLAVEGASSTNAWLSALPRGVGVQLAATVQPLLNGNGSIEVTADLVYSSPRCTRRLTRQHDARTELLARALSTGFSAAELRQLMAAAPLIERLGQSI